MGHSLIKPGQPWGPALELSQDAGNVETFLGGQAWAPSAAHTLLAPGHPRWWQGQTETRPQGGTHRSSFLPRWAWRSLRPRSPRDSNGPSSTGRTSLPRRPLGWAGKWFISKYMNTIFHSAHPHSRSLSSSQGPGQHGRLRPVWVSLGSSLPMIPSSGLPPPPQLLPWGDLLAWAPLWGPPAHKGPPLRPAPPHSAGEPQDAGAPPTGGNQAYLEGQHWPLSERKAKFQGKAWLPSCRLSETAHGSVGERWGYSVVCVQTQTGPRAALTTPRSVQQSTGLRWAPSEERGQSHVHGVAARLGWAGWSQPHMAPVSPRPQGQLWGHRIFRGLTAGSEGWSDHSGDSRRP